jgi:hypothetical protein
MTSTDLIKGLRLCNPNLTVPDPSVFTWYPLQASGHTSLWLGEPFKGKKITVFRLGAIPEWTQIDPKGLIIARGWRSVLSRVIRSRAVSLSAVERVFKISMDVGGPDASCPQCRREGLGIIPATSASGMCNTHDHAWKQIARAKREKKDAPLSLASRTGYEARRPVSVNTGVIP